MIPKAGLKQQASGQAFLAVGRALLEIRDKKLYRGTHATFDAYCHERWGISAAFVESLEDVLVGT